MLFAHHHHLHRSTTGMFSAEQDASPHLTSSVLVLRGNTLAGRRCSNIENLTNKSSIVLFSSQIHACC